MKVLILLLGFCLVPASFVLGEPLSVDKLGFIRVGARLPGFSGVSQKDVEIGPTTPAGKFFVHFVSDTLPPTCLDEECGRCGRQIKERGGHLIGGSDGKLAKQFGVRLISSRPWKFDHSVVVIASGTGEVLGIFLDADKADILALSTRFHF